MPFVRCRHSCRADSGARRLTLARRAFSLVEVLVAITMLAGGLLALSATAASSLRLESMAVRRVRAASLVVNRFEQLRAAGCDVASGTDSVSGVNVHWRIDRGPLFSEVHDSAEIHDGPGPTHRERIRGAVIC